MNPDLSAPLTHEEFVSLRDCAKGFDAPDNPSRTQRPTDPTRVHTGIVGRTSTNERWQAEDCGRQMSDKHPKRPRDPNQLWPKASRICRTCRASQASIILQHRSFTQRE